MCLCLSHQQLKIREAERCVLFLPSSSPLRPTNFPFALDKQWKKEVERDVRKEEHFIAYPEESLSRLKALKQNPGLMPKSVKLGNQLCRWSLRSCWCPGDLQRLRTLSSSMLLHKEQWNPLAGAQHHLLWYWRQAPALTHPMGHMSNIPLDHIPLSTYLWTQAFIENVHVPLKTMG